MKSETYFINGAFLILCKRNIDMFQLESLGHQLRDDVIFPRWRWCNSVRLGSMRSNRNHVVAYRRAERGSIRGGWRVMMRRGNIGGGGGRVVVMARVKLGKNTRGRGHVDTRWNNGPLRYHGGRRKNRGGRGWPSWRSRWEGRGWPSWRSRWEGYGCDGRWRGERSDNNGGRNYEITKILN